MRTHTQTQTDAQTGTCTLKDTCRESIQVLIWKWPQAQQPASMRASRACQQDKQLKRRAIEKRARRALRHHANATTSECKARAQSSVNTPIKNQTPSPRANFLALALHATRELNVTEHISKSNERKQIPQTQRALASKHI
jgi:hypothetical protein